MVSCFGLGQRSGGRAPMVLICTAALLYLVLSFTEIQVGKTGVGHIRDMLSGSADPADGRLAELLLSKRMVLWNGLFHGRLLYSGIQQKNPETESDICCYGSGTRIVDGRRNSVS